MIQKALKQSAQTGTPCLRSIFLTNRDSIKASSRASAHVTLEAAKTLPTRVRHATLVMSTMNTVVAACDLVAWEKISYRGTLYSVSQQL